MEKESVEQSEGDDFQLGYEGISNVDDNGANNNVTNNAQPKPTKKKVNVLFLVTTLLFFIGLLLCIVAGIMTIHIWCHDRDNGSCHAEHLKVYTKRRLFPLLTHFSFLCHCCVNS